MNNPKHHVLQPKINLECKKQLTQIFIKILPKNPLQNSQNTKSIYSNFTPEKKIKFLLNFPNEKKSQPQENFWGFS